jgi:hypothetical protein
MITRFQRIEENQVALRHSWWTGGCCAWTKLDPTFKSSSEDQRGKKL